MALRIVAIQTSGSYPEHITKLKVRYGPSKEEWRSREQMYVSVRKGNKYEVNHFPFPKLVAAISSGGTRYVHSEGNGTKSDNLMKLPRW